MNKFEGGAYLYILLCADGSYYTGTARLGLEQRVAEHNSGAYGGYTAQGRLSNWSSRNGLSALRTRLQQSDKSRVGLVPKKKP